MKNIHVNRNAIKNIFSRVDKNKVSVLDLFFDITLIIFIGGVTHELIASISQGDNWRNIFIDMLQIFSVFFIWRIYMIFAIYSFQGITFRVVTMIVMGSLVMMGLGSYFAASTQDVFLLNIVGFCLALFSILVVFITWVSNHEKGTDAYKRVISLISTFVLGITLSLIALGINYSSISSTAKRDFIIGVWTINIVQLILFDLASSIWSGGYSREVVDLIEERYNVLFVLFSGEGLITIISIFAQSHHGGEIFDSSFWYILMSFFIIFGWWWLFNDYVVYTKLRKGKRFVNGFTYMMIPFLICIALIFVGIALMIEGHNKSGAITFAIPLSIIILLFPLLLLLQEFHRESHLYLRSKRIEVVMIVLSISFAIIQLTIDILFPKPFLILGLNLGIVFTTVIIAFLEYVLSLKHYLENPNLYKVNLQARLKDSKY